MDRTIHIWAVIESMMDRTVYIIYSRSKPNHPDWNSILVYKHRLFNIFSLCSFERELKNKLAEKTKGAQSEQQVLMKSFKYFDLNDNGTVEPDEFAKAIEKIGIQIPTQSVSRDSSNLQLFGVLETVWVTLERQSTYFLLKYIFN